MQPLYKKGLIIFTVNKFRKCEMHHTLIREYLFSAMDYILKRRFLIDGKRRFL